jgi:hypothetical protein
VNLIDQTTKVGWSRGTLFVERQTPLEGTNNPAHMDPAELDRVVKAALTGRTATVDWDTARLAFRQATSVPVRIGMQDFSRVPAGTVPPVDTATTTTELPTPCASLSRKRKRRGGPRRFRFASRRMTGDYLPIERLNARSIFSLVASQQDCEACAACMAWLAVLWAALAALPALEAAAAAASAADLAAAASAAAALAAALAASIFARVS